ncbi:MAG: hypothetical protein KJ718_03710 [Nanoarchaeota archaeon]|nr:hypothetical protein [Nanoarchaeota archaeon]MBU1051637.1 hypothetical protein [Nanoarchaeota archaeon]MBU1988839.1 hypothetical protein [Nanoarchaeota archaeon]
MTTETQPQPDIEEMRILLLKTHSITNALSIFGSHLRLMQESLKSARKNMLNGRIHQAVIDIETSANCYLSSVRRLPSGDYQPMMDLMGEVFFGAMKEFSSRYIYQHGGQAV